MDELDRRLLGFLRANARVSVATLAHRLNVARGTINNRISRMEDDGVIAGYTVLLRPDVDPHEITAWTNIAVDGNRTKEVIEVLMGEPGVAALYDTNGRWDLLAELRALTLADLAEGLERIRLIRGISATETSIHLQTYKLR